MKRMNTRIACGVLAASLAMGLAGCSKAPEVDGTQIVATVGDEEVTLGLASYLLRDQQAQTMAYYEMFSSSYGMDMSGVTIWDEEAEDGTTYADEAKAQVMDSIKSMYALKLHAADFDVEITEEEQANIDEAAKAFIESNEEDTLKAMGVSESDIAEYLTLITLESKMYNPMVADVDTEVTEEEANQTKITMSRISIKGTETDEDGNTIPLTEEELAEKKELAQQVLDAVKEEDNIAEADMDAIAEAVSEDFITTTPSFTTAGSEDDVLDKAVIEAVLEMEDGELVPQVVEGEESYFVVRMDAYFDEDSTETKKATIVASRQSDAYDALLAEWVEAIEMTIDEDIWAQVVLTDSQPYAYKEEAE